MRVMKKLSHQTTQLVAAYVVVLFGLALIALAFFVPPIGSIDPSVLAAFGEILTFAGAILGLDYRYKAKSAPSSGKPQA